MRLSSNKFRTMTDARDPVGQLLSDAQRLTKFGVGVNSGTAGLHLGVIAADVQPGDLVITTPFSFIASANSIRYERGVPSRPYFTPIHLQPFYRDKFGYQRGDFPVTEYLGDVSLALPFSGVMTEEQVDYVCRELQASVRTSRQD